MNIWDSVEFANSHMGLRKFNDLDLTKFQALTPYKIEEDNFKEESSHPSPTIQLYKQPRSIYTKTQHIWIGLISEFFYNNQYLYFLLWISYTPDT